MMPYKQRLVTFWNRMVDEIRKGNLQEFGVTDDAD